MPIVGERYGNSIHTESGRCCVLLHGGGVGKPEQCSVPPVWRGFVRFTYPKVHLVEAEACDGHLDVLIEPTRGT